jgi:hypothetical protein
MTDLEELFRPLIEEGARYREPIETIETRARARDSLRRSRRRAQYRFGAGLMAVALITAAVAVVSTRRDAGSGRSSPLVTTTPTSTGVALTVPPGWHTYDYGLARISVPPDFNAVSGNGCGAPDGPLLEMQSAADNTAPVCGHDPAVVLSPIGAPADFEPLGLAGSVNGIDYFSVPSHCPPQPVPPSTSAPTASVCTPSVWVPALHVTILFAFNHRDRVADIAAIIDTLNYSTYARMVQQPFAPAPASWKTIALGGYSVRVPTGWRVVDLDKNHGFCSPDRNTVYLGVNDAGSCAFVGGSISPPHDSLQLSLVPTDHFGTPSTDPRSTVLHHNGLTLIQSPASGPLVYELGFVVEGGPRPIQLDLGLGLDPVVTRGILGSLKMP